VTGVTVVFAEQALLPSGWARDVRIGFAGARIGSVTTGAAPGPDDDRCHVAVPTIGNLHSHAFQRAMAGMAERRGAAADSFWTWREAMYRVALTMGPQDVEDVALLAYVEMVEAGFGRVGEFHYLHHERDGGHYTNIAELAERVAAAAGTAGIALTLLPVFYAHSTFGGSAPNQGQRRFINDIGSFSRLLDSSRKAVGSMPEAIVGIAPHSLRAVTPAELSELVTLAGNGPLHIHIAEQMKEVDDCIAWSGARPVEWLLANAPVDQRWCLVHATHMIADETVRTARSGAVAGLCPITEANLGDGIFSGEAFVSHGGRYGIGSDSNVLIGLVEELRQFEYSQRLALRARNVMATGEGSTGRGLFDAAHLGAARALGASAGGIAPGAPADLLSLDVSDPTFEGKAGDAMLDAWIFAGRSRADRVWISGRKLVEGGRHRMRDEAEQRYRAAMRRLADL
jgi:formimidoylglutamate deiminase